MAIKVTIPAEKEAVTVSGLFQWDYGQVLDIECTDIGSEIVEVHFACSNMSEAIVRPCSFSNGVGTVTIPDQCLEQTTPITAWIYKIAGSAGHTVKTITLPITARTRPSKVRDEIPQEFIDKYTELITEINEAVENLEYGNVTSQNAEIAQNAIYAATAGNAQSASYATSAGNAQSANTTQVATYSHSLVIPTDGNEVNSETAKISSPGIYAILLNAGGSSLYSEIMFIPKTVFESATETEIYGQYAVYDVVGTYFRPYNDLTTILKVCKIASFPEG